MRIVCAAIGLFAFVASLPTPTNACDAWSQDCSSPSSTTADVVAGGLGGKVVGGRPAGCPRRQWCGCWLALRKYGKHVRRLWLARNWAQHGRPAAGPAPGVIAVYARGGRGGHVGIVTRVIDRNTVVLLSGNDGRKVRKRRWPTRGVIAWRWVS